MTSKDSNKITLWVVQVAEYCDENGELDAFAKVFTALEDAAKWTVKDYNRYCKSYDDTNTLSKDAFTGLMKSKHLESPGEEMWGSWVKWIIEKQTIKV